LELDREGGKKTNRRKGTKKGRVELLWFCTMWGVATQNHKGRKGQVPYGINPATQKAEGNKRVWDNGKAIARSLFASKRKKS